MAFQLVLRVCWPKLLDQGNVGFCGPTTVLYEFAKRYPLGYAKCGINLIEKGKGWVSINQGVHGFEIALDVNDSDDWEASGAPESWIKNYFGYVIAKP